MEDMIMSTFITSDEGFGSCAMVSYIDDNDDIEKELNEFIKCLRMARRNLSEFGGCSNSRAERSETLRILDKFFEKHYTIMMSSFNQIPIDLSYTKTGTGFAELDLNPQTYFPLHVIISIVRNKELIRYYTAIL